MYDIVIIAAIKDFQKIKFIYESIIQNITGYNKVYCFCPEYPQDKIEGIEYMLDKNILDINMSDVHYKPTWVYQQYLKLLQNITLDTYLVVDADIVINKPISIFENDKPTFFFSNSMTYTPFFNYSKTLFGIDRLYDQSFVSEFMLFERGKIKELIVTKFATINDFINASNSIITTRCFPSEYELYGNYIYKTDKDSYNYKQLNASPMVYKDWTVDEIKLYIEKYKDSRYDIIKISSLN